MIRVLVLGIWSMIVLGLGVGIGGGIVRGQPIEFSTTTQAEVDQAWDALLVCSYRAARARTAMDSVLMWLSIPREGQDPPVVRVAP